MNYQKNLSRNPSLSIGIPTLNEESYIEGILSTFLGTGYDNLIEVLVCDGGSTDRTREIVTRISKNDSRVKLIDNPHQKQVYAFNKMIELAKGELLMIAGAHAYYEDKYVEKCINLHKTTDALNVGGPTKLKANSKSQAGILLAWYSKFGNGGAKHRNPSYTGYTDTLFPGCYVTAALRQVGGFNIANVTNQDSEINLRISELSDFAHYIDSDISVYYYPRDSFSSLAKQYFRYGRGRYLTSIKHFPSIPLRGYISFIFLWFNITLVTLSLTNLIAKKSLLLYPILISLLFLELFSTYQKYLKSKNDWYDLHNKPSFLTIVFKATIALGLMHFSMGIGFTFQLLKSIFTMKTEW